MVYPCLSLSSTLGPATVPIILASGELITLEVVLRTSLALFCPAFTIAAPYSLRAALSFSSMWDATSLAASRTFSAGTWAASFVFYFLHLAFILQKDLIHVIWSRPILRVYGIPQLFGKILASLILQIVIHQVLIEHFIVDVVIHGSEGDLFQLPLESIDV
jgi:hypothetical protein